VFSYQSRDNTVNAMKQCTGYAYENRDVMQTDDASNAIKIIMVCLYMVRFSFLILCFIIFNFIFKMSLFAQVCLYRRKRIAHYFLTLINIPYLFSIYFVNLAIWTVLKLTFTNQEDPMEPPCSDTKAKWCFNRICCRDLLNYLMNAELCWIIWCRICWNYLPKER
jgi:hypothetical protein